MYLLLIKNYKNKVILVSTIFILSLSMIVGFKILIDKTDKYTFISGDISISFPINFNISDIYLKNNHTVPYIQTINNSYKSFIDFKSPKEGFEFSYPSIFEINQLNFPGSEILSHIDFKNKDNKMKNGFVQVWNLPYSLEEFLDDSKKNAMVDFIDFSSKKIETNNLSGYLWEYSFSGASVKYKALEAFFYKDSKLYRISYFMPLNEFNPDEYNMYWQIVKSFKVK